MVNLPVPGTFQVRAGMRQSVTVENSGGTDHSTPQYLAAYVKLLRLKVQERTNL